MLKQMRIYNLYNRFNYTLEFKDDGVTIITGPNGYGKSTILKCIEALGHANFKYILELDFNRLELYFDKNETNSICITKQNNKIVINNMNFEKKMLLNIIEASKIESTTKKTYITPNIYKKNRYNEELFLYDEIESEFDEIFLEKMICKRLEFIGGFGSYNNVKVSVRDFKSIEKQIKKLIDNVYFIREQRLIKGIAHERFIDVIEELPEKFKKHINNISNKYSSISNKLDSSYPNRLFNTEIGINEGQYKENMNEMNKKFSKLIKYDISDIQNNSNVIFKEEHSKALKIYFEDFNEKYKVYEEFIGKLDLFTEIINNRLSFKKVKISRVNGISVVDEENNKQLQLKQLSSGEKQEILLFYELLFETSENVLLLIDEPEISLHIIWQEMFMNDLIKIVEYKKFKVIVATHSPHILNNHWDRQIDLGGLYSEQLNKR